MCGGLHLQLLHVLLPSTAEYFSLSSAVSHGLCERATYYSIDEEYAAKPDSAWMEFDEVKEQVTHLDADEFPLVELTVDGKHFAISSAFSVMVFSPSAFLPVVSIVAPGCLFGPSVSNCKFKTEETQANAL